VLPEKAFRPSWMVVSPLSQRDSVGVMDVMVGFGIMGEWK
jgi:hypothetical protein